MRLNFGPGLLVAAAFVGPGTVTACTLAGANFGYALIWALVFATIATVILQDMAARLGTAARLGLGEALMQVAPNVATKWALGGLVFAALALGNSAYEAGNLTGAALGLEAVLGEGAVSRKVLVLGLGFTAVAALVRGEYKFLETALVTLVILMGAAFVLSAILIQPDFGAMFAGLNPQVPSGGLITAVALIGTTIVPYNLFLHAASVRQKWQHTDNLGAARMDSGLSIGLGGLVSILILSTAAASIFGSEMAILSAADMAVSLQPAFGDSARYLIGIGLFAAGLTSAITAPMATAFALSEIIGGDVNRRAVLFRATAISVVMIGTGLSVLGIKPIELILVAQYANGLLLPIIATFLLVVMNRKSLLGVHVNGVASNVAGTAVVLITFGLGARVILRAAGIMP